MRGVKANGEIDRRTLRPHTVDLTGEVVNRLTVLRLADEPGRHRKWLCRCECGALVGVCQADLKRRRTKSCGCIKNKSHIKHGASKTPEFVAWAQMRKRCSEAATTVEARRNYFERGIRVCPEWDADFSAFLADMGPRPSPKHSIDRIDNDGDYDPGNCRWATQLEQSNNRGCTIYALFDGEMTPVAEIARRTGISRGRVHSWAAGRGGPRGTILENMQPITEQREPYGRNRRGNLLGPVE